MTGVERISKTEAQFGREIAHPVTPGARLWTVGLPEAFLIHLRFAVGAIDAHQHLCVRRDGQYKRIARFGVAMSGKFNPDLSFLRCVVADL